MPTYTLKCNKCEREVEITCSYEDLSPSLRCIKHNKGKLCDGEMIIQITTANIITRVRRWKKYYKNLGGRTESGK